MFLAVRASLSGGERRARICRGSRGSHPVEGAGAGAGALRSYRSRFDVRAPWGWRSIKPVREVRRNCLGLWKGGTLDDH